MRRGNRHALGAVDGGAAAHRNQAIAVVVFIDLCSGSHGCFGRVGRGLVKHSHCHARQSIQGLLQNACCFDTSVGDDQGAADAHALALLFEQFDRTTFKLNVGHVIDIGHGGFP